jgi:YbbR domain-containing protein
VKASTFFKKMHKKTLINQRFLTFFVLFLFFFINSCNFSTKNERIDCKWSPDYENISDEALNSLDDMKRINIMQMKAACNF